MNAQPVAVELPPEAVDRIAAVAAELVLEVLDAGGEPRGRYLTTVEAADYLRCSRQRIYDLTSARVLPTYKDGRKSLYLRDDLDAYLAEGTET